MAEVKFSQLPLAGALAADDVVVGLQQSGSASDDENVLITMDQIAGFVLGQDSNTGGGGNSFGTVSVSGQSDVVADSAGDTLTLVAGSNITITTNAGSDSVTIAAAGASGSVYRIHSNVTPVSSAASNPEQDLMTYSLPAGTLATNGQAVRITASGSAVSSSRSKTIKVYFGATALVTIGPSVSTSLTKWYVSALVARTGAATQLATNILQYTQVAGALSLPASPAETLSGAVTIKATATVGGSAVAGDITCDLLIVEVLP